MFSYDIFYTICEKGVTMAIIPFNKTDQQIGEATIAELERKASVDLLAFYYHERFEALVANGFTEEQAMDIIKTRGIMM